MTDYVHGYGGPEAARLHDQARTLESLLHHDTCYLPGMAVLEAGCGTGAQTVAVARRNPGVRLTSIDQSAGSLAEARERLAAAGLGSVHFEQADIFALPFAPASFDHLLLCFVLEHLPAPGRALASLLPLIRPGGTVTVIEGDHGSVMLHPESAPARAAVACQVELQRRAGGDANIGRRLYPLLADAGLAEVEVSPRMVYVDASRPALVEGFIHRTFTAMIAGVREPALAAGLTEPDLFEAGLAGLRRTAEADGSFCYTFFKARARLPG